MRLRVSEFMKCASTAMAVLILANTSYAGGVLTGSAVGGVNIDTDGVLSAPAVEDQQALNQVLMAALDAVPGNLDEHVELRFVSLKGIEAQINEARTKLLPVPEAVQVLSGLLRVEYVLVYPDRNDIVLAGPAEGWKIDRLGNVVGKTTGRPVLLLDDLMTALRTASTSAETGISCSIDPSPAGLQRLQQTVRSLKTIGNPERTIAAIEQSLGTQIVTVTGLPQTSHFARSMVAADFRMKRLAMGFEESPIPGLPNYLTMLRGTTRGMQSMLPRWWLAPNYEPLRTGADGLAWEIRGTGVKCLTEDDYVDQAGSRQHTGKASAAAQKWADLFSERFDELSAADSAFGHLRNAMDLAVAAAIIHRHGLIDKAGLSAPRILGDEMLEQFNSPQTVASKASFIKRGRKWIISASGGVNLNPWPATNNPLESAEVASLHASAPTADSWYWHGK